MAEKPNSMYRKAPSLAEDVGKNIARDTGKLADHSMSSARGAARAALDEGATRAATRMLGRAGYAGAALDAGWEAGRALDRATGIGKKMVNAVLGEPKYEGERVTLSKRDPEPDYGNEGKRTKSETHAQMAKGRERASSYAGGPVRDGKNENIDEDTRRRAGKFVGDL